MTKSANRRLPSSGPAREILQKKGQFWTPEWVANAMVAWAARDSDHIFDPAIGAGAFFAAAKRLAVQGKKLSFSGGELYRENLEEAFANGLTNTDLAHVRIGDFLRSFGAEDQFDSIVANPPYIRHHRFDLEYKAFLQNLAVTTIGTPIDARAGIHVFFLIKALTHLQPGGRLAFILPSDICEGKFSSVLWKWISGRYRICAAVTFDHAASPFPGVDTNAIVLMIQNAKPEKKLKWARVKRAETEDLFRWCADDLGKIQSDEVLITEREINEASTTGLSRPPVAEGVKRDTIPLGHFVTVIRGIATGDNDFFFLTSKRIEDLGLPRAKFVRAIGRTRDIAGAKITQEDLSRLDIAGRPTYLLNLDREEKQQLPPAMQDYITVGETAGL
ncbi:MAG: N-6 DNA methylase, partial [Alphaproteobacteria bacterium]|nr:N-6 DNA methylase [Alphaproteobacteria bacterium]